MVHRSVLLRHSSLAFAAAACLALPWYARNVILGGWGNAVPSPGDFYYAQAQPGLLNLIPFLPSADEFGYGAAPLYVLGLVGGLALCVRLIGNRSPSGAGLQRGAVLQFAFILPYFILWWKWFSYDPRFLLTVLPFYAALAGLTFEWLAGRVQWRPQPVWVAALAGVLVLGGTYSRLGGVYQTLTHPFASDAEKLAHARPDVASTVQFLRATAAPGRDRIYTMDGRLTYYLTDYSTAVGYPSRLADLREYDYFVVGSWAAQVYAAIGQGDSEVMARLADPAAFQPVFVSELGTLTVYRVVDGQGKSEGGAVQ